MRVLLGASALAFCMGFSAQAVADVATGVKLLESGDVQGSVEEFQASFAAGDADGAFYIGRLFQGYRKYLPVLPLFLF